MKTLAKIIVVMGLFPVLAGCGRTYHVNNVEISPNRELEKDFLVEYGIGSFSGDITYKAKKEIALQEDRRYIYGDPGDYCPDEDEYETVTFFNIDSIGDKQNYSITSHDKGGFKLEVKASVCGEDTYFKRYLYNNITLIHPLHMPHDSIVCTNLRFEGHNYGWELNEYASRPCAGKIKVYHVDRDEKYLSREMAEASEEKTVWREYYPNGNVKSIKTTTANPQEADEYGFAAEPFVTNAEYYFEDGTKKTIEDVIYKQHGNYALFASDLRRGSKKIWAVFLKEEQMVVFVSSNNIHRQLEAELRYNYEIRENKLRFYNGWERYGIANVKHYPETSAEIFLTEKGVSFKNMKKYGNLNIQMDATLKSDRLHPQLLDYVKKYAHTTLRGE